jgi:predicted P-loop ATPase
MISLYEKKEQKSPSENVSIDWYIEAIKNGKWQDDVLAVRTGKMKKDSVPVVTLSGVFKGSKSNDALVEHSGYICIDVDAKDQITQISKEVLTSDPYAYCVHDSVSGNGGFVVIVKIDPAKHEDAFLGLEKYFFTNYSIVIDQSCKNVSRLRYISFDPDLKHNPKAKIFKQYLKKIEKRNVQLKRIVVKNDFDQMVNQASGMNLFDDYNDYIKCAFALANEFGEMGRSYFHALCQSSDKYNYDRAEKDYDKAVARNKTGITIASLYYIFAQNGIALKSEETQIIENVVKLSDNPEKVLKEKGITADPDLVKKLQEKENRERCELDDVIDMIKLEKIRFNEITRNFEFNGVEMNDRILAEFYTKVWLKIDDSISKDKIFTLIQNRNNTESYNPIHDWFERNKNLVTNNEFQKLKNCFEINHTIHYENNSGIVIKDEYLDMFLKKWLIGLIASAYGTYSLMILVLNGEQGTNKTKFFRNLLPEDLRGFYAESNLDEGKDSEILMTKKWLIVDDEFGGKSKKDATKLKRLSSQQTFSIRMPYGRVSEDLLRLAVLGGTSNDYEVINDPTGNRRVIPINIVSFDVSAYEAIDKNKLFIELYKEWKSDPEGWFLSKHEIDILNRTTVENQDIMIEEELIMKSLEFNIYGVLTTSEITAGLMSRYTGVRTNPKRVGMALKKLGFEQKIKKIKGKTTRVYELQWEQ